MTREEALRLALEATPNDPAKAIQTARDMLAFLSEEPKSAFSPPASKPTVADAAPDLLAGWTPLPHNPPDVAEPSGLTEQAKILLGLTVADADGLRRTMKNCPSTSRAATVARYTMPPLRCAVQLKPVIVAPLASLVRHRMPKT